MPDPVRQKRGPAPQRRRGGAPGGERVGSGRAPLPPKARHLSADRCSASPRKNEGKRCKARPQHAARHRVQPGWSSGAADLHYFFQHLEGAAGLTWGELAAAALKRIQPPNEPAFRAEEPSEDEAMLEVAMTGLAFLIENAATDRTAKTRRTRREDNLIEAIGRYNEAHRRAVRKSRELVDSQRYSRGSRHSPSTQNTRKAPG
jgi:hypothetical protein